MDKSLHETCSDLRLFYYLRPVICVLSVYIIFIKLELYKLCNVPIAISDRYPKSFISIRTSHCVSLMSALFLPPKSYTYS